MTLAPATFFINASNVTNAMVSRRFMGCHSDSGFAHQPQTLNANMLSSPAFDVRSSATVQEWTQHCSPGALFSIGLEDVTAFAANPSMHIGISSAGWAAVVNRGLGGAGLHLRAGHAYDVEVWAYTYSNTTLFVQLRDRSHGNISLAYAEAAVHAGKGHWFGATWRRFNFTLTPSTSTACVAIRPGEDPSVACGSTSNASEHVCVRCGGELLIGLSSPSGTRAQDVNLGFATLMPGAWGRVQARDGRLLPVLKETADALQHMGVRFLRSGGTFSQSMRWRSWRGAWPWRPSSQHRWGTSPFDGWGPFEVADLCGELGIECMLTLAYDSNDADDWGDLVEYCWGDGQSSTLGRRRRRDGHATPFNVTVFELGNEQPSPHWVEQVAAMEARAKALGPHVPPLRYVYPSPSGLPQADRSKARAAGLPLERLLADVHVGSGGAVARAAALFAADPTFPQGALNGETNAGTHDLGRALAEAIDLIAFFTADQKVAGRLYARTASFCTSSSTDTGQYDQGLIFRLPNMTWLQPPAHTHAMIHQTWADATVQTTPLHGRATHAHTETPPTAPPPNSLHLAAQLETTAGRRLIVRAVNSATSPQPLELQLSAPLDGRGCSAMVLHGNQLEDVNTPADVTKIAPKTVPIICTAGESLLTFTLPPLSFTVLNMDMDLQEVKSKE